MIPDAVMKIAFDRFRVARHLGDAVDKVRRAEHRALVKEGNGILVGTRWQWLKGPSRKTHAEKLVREQTRLSGNWHAVFRFEDGGAATRA